VFFDSAPYDTTIWAAAIGGSTALSSKTSLPQKSSGRSLYSLPSTLLFASQSTPRQFKYSSKLIPGNLQGLLQSGEIRAISQRYQLRHGWNRNLPTGCSALGKDFVSQCN